MSENIVPDQSGFKQTRLVWAFAACISLGIALYAFTRAFVWDEGFHAVAAQMILAGKRPYLDFCFPQTPLNAYWNAFWMWLLHPSWRVLHIPSTLELAGCAFLLAHYLLQRSSGAWRVARTLAGLALFGLNATVLQFGPIAQAYAICAFTLIAAFVLITGGPGLGRCFLAGLSLGAGAASSLLIAPAALPLVIWSTLRSRLVGASAFVVGLLIPFAPVFWLFSHGPHQTWFNVVQYQAIFRRADWKPETAFTHDFDVLTSWFDSGQIFLLAIFAIAALSFFLRRDKQETRLRAEWWLAFWTSLLLVVYISTAHPTFGRYFVVGMPLYAIVAAPGLMVIGERLGTRPMRSVFVLIALLAFGLLRAQINELDAATWQRYESIASTIARVTPRGSIFYSDEHVYFLLHRLPPPGLEFSYSHKVDLPPKEAALLHIIPDKQLKQQITNGVYATVESCDDDKIDAWNLTGLYKHKQDIADCSIFWGYSKP
jgi:hypothetical protein